jgi:predicted mannosyl-3-phosphoglycerate phosphatase (HAD superfamily)
MHSHAIYYVEALHKSPHTFTWSATVAALLLKRCATAGDSCNDILMLDGKMPAIVVSGCTGSKHKRRDHAV